MATIVAQANGNFSAGATWVGGVKPQPGDIAQTGNFTVTIDENFTGTLNPTGSGRFDVAVGGITITGDLVMQPTYTGGGLRCIHTSGEVTLNGTATGGAGASAYGAQNNAAGTLNVTTATGGAGSYAYGALNNAADTLNVTTATGGAGTSAYGAYNSAAGTLNVTTATGGAGNTAHGAFNNAAGTLNCDLAIGSSWGVGGSGAYTHGLYGNGAAGQVTTVKRIQSGPYGCVAIGGAVLMLADASNSAQFRTAYGGATLTLTDPGASADWPAESDVRAGVEYDLGDKTGTAHIPAAGQVALGIPVDATTGTAVLTAAAVTAGVWDAARSGHAGAGTFGATAEWAGSVDEAAIATATLAAMEDDPPAVNVTYSAGVALSGRLAEAVDLPSEPLDATATQAAAAAALTAYDPPTKTEMDAGFTALNDLDAAGIRLAVGLATANLDMQLSTIDGIVDDLALVAPDNKPIVNVDGETLAYMTALSEEEIAAAVVVALQETPVEVICITPQPSQESDYDILRNNATNC